MSDKTPFASLNKVGTYLDEDLPKINENTDILDAQLKQAYLERQEEAQSRAEGDAALDEKIMQEAHARAEDVAAEAAARSRGDSDLAALLQEEATARAGRDAELAEAIEAVESTADKAAQDASIALNIVTSGHTDPIIGIALVETGSGVGVWLNVDKDGTPISPTKRYFDYHPTYAALTRQMVDGQIMIRHDKFYTKTGLIASGELAGKHARWISPTQIDSSWRCHPAFMKNGGEVNNYWLGAYQAADTGSSKAGSRPNTYPLVNLNFETMLQRCSNRNVGGVAGFCMWEWSMMAEVQLLALIEYATPDMQSAIGRGRVDTSSANLVDGLDVAQATWRGHVGLWGNVWQMVNGIRLTASRQLEMFDNEGRRTYINTGFVYPTWSEWGYPYTFNYSTGAQFNLADLFIPDTGGGALASGSTGDAIYQPTANGVYYHGGNWSGASSAGLFCAGLNGPASYSSASIGCRLAKI